MYLVYYYGGDYEDSYKQNIFVTESENVAKTYCSKFNKKLKFWKNYYKKFEDENKLINWIKEEFIETWFYRWYGLQKISGCSYNKIEKR